MEDNNNNTFFTFDSPKGQSSYIKVIGVGGGGGNAVNHMYKQGIEGVDFIVCNTDMKALSSSPVPNKIPLGDLGLGAGNKPERARHAAEAKADDIREALSHNTQMLFITAGMGGGTGTGAAPVIAEIAKSIDLDNDENKKILVVAIVTRPFSFEGKRRREQAEAGIEELRKHVDSIIVINNDKLRSFGNMRISEAFGMADDVLLTAAKGIAEIITENAYVNRDFQDVNTVMEHSGTALMGTGSGRGENRAHDAIEAATTSVLLDDSDISGAKNVLLYFSYSSENEMTMDEQAEITDYVLDRTNGTADIIWGAGPDESLGDELKVILIATGFDKSSAPAGPQTFVLPSESHESPKASEAPAPSQPAVQEPVEEMVLISHQPEPPAPKVEDHAAESQRRVFVLEDVAINEPATSASDTDVVYSAYQEPDSHGDTLVDAIHLVQADVVAEPVAEQQPEPVQAAPKQPEPPVVQSAFRSDNDALAVAERIRMIHDLLRNNPDGADIVQHLDVADGQDELYQGAHSSAREASSLKMGADGSITRNPYLYGNQPD